jgi:CheY-like chemotaxis protein
VNLDATAVENGRLARDELLREDVHYDLVLLDLYMPEMNGLELLDIMRENEKLRMIPVIMMSADNEGDMIATCIKNGA